MQPTKIIIHHHLGLGDHIVCNGLVRTLAKRYEKVYLPCKERNLNSVRFLYKDSPKVEVFGVKNEVLDVLRFSLGVGVPIQRVGFEKTRSDWDRSFYDHAGVPFSHKWSEFRLPESPWLNIALEYFQPPIQYRVVSNRCSQGVLNLNLPKDGLTTVFTEPFPGERMNIFTWASLIECAEEVHCIDSAFIHLCDQLDTRGELFFHKKRASDGMTFTLKKEWEEVNYDAN